MNSVGPRSIPFRGLQARALSGLLQLGFVRYHRVQLGFVRTPDQYAAFLADTVAPRLAALGDRIGVFGVGSHTEVVLDAIPDLHDRIACFTDNNSSLWHQTRYGKPVLPPADAVGGCEAFFLSTAVFQHVLRGDLRTLGFQGAVVAVDDDVPPAWFLSS